MLLTTTQVAERLGVERHTVYRMIERGQLTPIKISDRNFKFDPQELDRFLAGQAAS